ncbi:sensor histidine kinase [Longitalea arenae]|uniref:sensor histidine kinase n=1 Tax=Longitalea arenae TaxID=2812558 RepID=UPI001F0830F0|nr:histidine kinase [Longitalea arenae]
MMQTGKYPHFSWILHALAWSIVLLFPYFISSAGDQYRIGPLPGAYFTWSQLLHMIIFYGNSFFLYPKLLNRNYWWLYLFAAVLLILLSVRIKFYILEAWFPNDLAGARTHVLFPSVLAFIVSVFYSITVEKIRTEKEQKEKEALQLGMELKFLRSQISPHFLFNVLTNLVSLARKRSDQLEPSLLMLSGLMRYMLYNADKKISLQQEVDYLHSYVALQQLRFGRDVKIIFNSELSPAARDYCIEPMLLIPFVENAFKHGTDYADQPYIDIHLTARDGVLDFRVENRFERLATAGKDETSGIGLGNVRSRLTLLYPGRFDLGISEDQNLFRIHLTLKIL